jgi:hypothetical protein
VAGASAGAGRLNLFASLTNRKTAKAARTKSTTVLKKIPQLMVAAPGKAGFIVAWPCVPSRGPKGGIRTSATKDAIIFPKAAPVMVPAAMRAVSPFIENSLNSVCVRPPLRGVMRMGAIVRFTRSQKQAARRRKFSLEGAVCRSFLGLPASLF